MKDKNKNYHQTTNELKSYTYWSGFKVLTYSHYIVVIVSELSHYKQYRRCGQSK